MDLMERILDLSQCGWFCSQILGKLLLETTGAENPELIKALGGLNGGVGYSQGCCGCMTGGCCLISYFTGKAEDTGYENENHKAALGEFTEWFKDEMMVSFGGIECSEITKGNPALRLETCPQIIADTYMKCIEILQERELIG